MNNAKGISLGWCERNEERKKEKKKEKCIFFLFSCATLISVH